MRALWELMQMGRLEDARELQLRILELFDAMLYSADFPEGFRAAVELRGFNFGASRQPLSSAQAVDRVALQRVLQCILADFGVVDAPAEGCIPRSGNLERDKIEQVTAAVMAALRERE
jgi:4-hydroxy-tetrahydrodipicolinate synthase